VALLSIDALDGKPFKDEVLSLIKRDAMESLRTSEILTWAVEKFHPRLTISASFGAPEGMVLIDMLHRLDPSTRVFVLDTGRLHPATYDLIDRVRDRYDKQIEVVFPEAGEVQEMVREKGMNLFYESHGHRRLCCDIRKVRPMRRHLAGFDAYITGLRRDQNANRASTRKLEVDSVNGDLVKLNPLADWTHERVMDYVAEHRVPTNRLHQQGYPSVGCEPCTRAVAPDADPRSGRWWWENDDLKECGLHLQEQADGSGI
jgi:phosphoadenosine phosphosulfate reductase